MAPLAVAPLTPSAPSRPAVYRGFSKQAWGSAPATGGEAVTNDKEYKTLLDTLIPREDIAPLTEAQELEARTRYQDYSRRMMAREHAWRKDLQDKIELKRAALEALPEELRKVLDGKGMGSRDAR